MTQPTSSWNKFRARCAGVSPGLSRHALVIGAYAAVAVGFSWPLALNLGTHLLGDPAGDTGVYFWNQWVFRHELLETGHLPYFTDRIFATTGTPANLSLHNYTPFQNLVAIPLRRWLGPVASFNVVFLLMRVLTAYVTYLLACAVSRARWESWLAGLLFAWSPLMVTRGMGHLSLLAAAPLSLFLMLALRWSVRRHRWVAVGLGACIAWAVYSDVYYGVYCLAAGAVLLVRPVLSFPSRTAPLAARRVVDAGLVLVGCLCAAIAVTGGTSVSIAGAGVHIRTLYNPMFALAVLMLARLLLRRRVEIVRPDLDAFTAAMRSVVLAWATAAMLLTPLLYAFGVRVVQGRFDSSPVYWRSSPQGVDLLALVTPNPNHPLVPSPVRDWLEPASDRYLENVASLPLVGLLVIAVAVWRGWRPPPVWTWLAATFGALALGPFIHVAGVNTAFPGPWALLRYLPVLGLARTPARFAVVLTLAFAVLAAVALAWLTRRQPGTRRLVLASVTAALALELLPAPRTLHSASVPAFYRRVAEAPGDVRVLHVPFGLRDGTSSVGNFNARTQFFQTAHAKPLVGGYLSRVSRQRVASVRADDVLDLLLPLSEGRTLDAAQLRRLEDLAPGFVRRARVGFVVLDRARLPRESAAVLQGAMRLSLVATDGALELYEPPSRAK